MDVNASSLMTPDIHALWCGLACLAFGDITNKAFYWPECISFLPPFSPSSPDENKAVKLVDEPLKLIQHPWRYAFALWERARRQPSASSLANPNTVVEYGLGVVSLMQFPKTYTYAFAQIRPNAKSARMYIYLLSCFHFLNNFQKKKNMN